MSVIFRFADFELDGRSSELRKRGRRLRVQQQPLQILAMLVAAPDVSKAPVSHQAEPPRRGVAERLAR